MNTRRHWIPLTVFTALILAELTANSLGKISLSRQSLSAIKAMAVRVDCGRQELKEAGIEKEDIRKDVAMQLEQAGIEIVPWTALGKLAGRPHLRIIIKGYKIRGQEGFVHNVDVRFRQDVALDRDPQTKIVAATWEIGWLAYAGGEERLVKAIQENIKIMTNNFIRELQEANANRALPADVNNIAVVLPIVPGKQTKPTVKPTVKPTTAEHKYVASKNSKVFHKADCRWVKRIKPKNLVTYSTRNKAIEAGKRPCKLCKP